MPSVDISAEQLFVEHSNRKSWVGSPFARRVFELALADERLEPLSQPTLSICCYRYRAPDVSESTLDDLNAVIAQRLRMEGIVPPSGRQVRDSAVSHKSPDDDSGRRAHGRADSRDRRCVDKRRLGLENRIKPLLWAQFVEQRHRVLLGSTRDRARTSSPYRRNPRGPKVTCPNAPSSSAR